MSTPSAPFVAVLGTAQDAGVPHVGCCCEHCEAARANPHERRRAASLGIVSSNGKSVLIDATPSIESQLADLAALCPREPRACPSPDAVLLTHAHMGHYVGLAHLGTEGLNVKELPLYGTSCMHRFLKGNRPWSHLVDRGQVDLRLLESGQTLAMDDIHITAKQIPHRAEDTDTLGFHIKGPSKSVVYIPDADYFPDDWIKLICDADIALIDGTFYSADELPGRDLSLIPHPRIAESLPLFVGHKGMIRFIHLNHSNAMLRPDKSKRPVLPEGFAIADEGEVWGI